MSLSTRWGVKGPSLLCAACHYPPQGVPTYTGIPRDKAIRVGHAKMIKYNVFKVCHPKGIPKGTKTFSRVWAWVLGGPKVVYWGWGGRRYVSPVGVCGGVVAMVMIGGSARWQRGSLLEDFGHRGALELILQSLMYRSRGALHLNVLYRCSVYCTIEWSYL